jgi:hypothetical protein
MDNKECAICLEEIGNTNSCVTPCGHKFCFNCMVKALKQKDTCPMCRTALQEDDESTPVEFVLGTWDDYVSRYNEDIIEDIRTTNMTVSQNIFGSSNDEDYDEDYDYIITTNSMIATPNMLEKKIIDKGYTMEDIITLWTGRIDRLNPRYTQRFYKKLEMDVNSIIKNEDIEQKKMIHEQKLMEGEDEWTKKQNNMDIFERFPTIDLSRLFSALE